MNKQRRKAIQDVLSKLGGLPGMLELAGEVRALAEEEQEGFDNLSEGLQQSVRGQAMEAAAQALEEAADTLENFDLDDVLSKLEEACA